MSVSNYDYNYEASADDKLDLSPDDQDQLAANSHQAAESETSKDLGIDSTSEFIIQIAVLLLVAALVAVLTYIDGFDKTAEVCKRTKTLSVTAPTKPKYVKVGLGRGKEPVREAHAGGLFLER